MKFHTRVAATIGASVIAVSALAAPAIASAPAAEKPQRIVLNQAAPTLKVLENPGGNITIYGAPLTTTKGASAGVLTGTIIKVVGSGAGEGAEGRHRDLVFSLPKGQIVATGLSIYPMANAEIDANKPVTIAITGGTGRYMGVRGEVKTNRNADGSYRHVLTLLR